jgi:hypothetical protein
MSDDHAQSAQHQHEWALEQKKHSEETRRIAAVEYARIVHERFLYEVQASKDYGVMSLRSMFLLNGGAIIALLTLAGTILDDPAATRTDFIPTRFVAAFQAYVMGLVLAVLGMISGYFNFQLIAMTRAEPGDLANNIIQLAGTWPHDYKASVLWKIRGTLYFAVFVGLLSMLAFLWGCYLARTVFVG